MAELGDGWETYSKLVLQQLETLSNAIGGLRDELQEVKGQLVELKVKEDKVKELKEWKQKMDDVASPPQLRDTLHEIDELKEFRTKAVTIFMAVQTVMGIAMAWAMEIF
jgi:predicted TIM-barrel fold metal-dependent hydrolase